MVRRTIGSIIHSAKSWITCSLAALYRSLLRRTVFVGVTGSCGKTTTKELIAAVLAARFQGRKSPRSKNLPQHLARTVLSVRPWDDYCVVEIAAAVRGERIPLQVPLKLVQPQIGVVTNIETDHLSAFGTVEAIAAEKSKLISGLPPHGTAILNVDDERVRNMQTQCAARVITCGVAPDAMLRAENIGASWPERLSFTAIYEGQSCVVRTQLCGAHWVPSVLAALGVGIAMGVPLATASEAIYMVPPFHRRMSPVSHPDGVTFVLDNYKAPLWSIPSTLRFMREARAGRKIVVVGAISDYRGDHGRVYATVAREALSVADRVIFVGPRARKSLRARSQSQNEVLQAFDDVEAARPYVHNLLRPGDLVLLKDSDRERLDTIITMRTWDSGSPAVTNPMPSQEASRLPR
jgi:UDP-N-acetylmuramoyl-tripeptide--D-alanyl-D-alanine ligase